MGKIFDWFFGIEAKSAESLTPHSEEYIEARLSGYDPVGYVSVVYQCVRVIAEGLALPPIYVQQVTKNGREYSTRHPLHHVLSVRPNKTQTSYELRETMGWQAAISGNAYAWLNRSTSGEILEIVPLDPAEVSRIDSTQIGGAPSFLMSGQPKTANEIWHLKGPAQSRKAGNVTSAIATRAIALASIAEEFGLDMLKNRAALEGIISVDGAIDQAQLDRVRETFSRRQTGAGKRGRTAFIPAAVKYQPLSSTATDAQWIEARRFQIEEICRYFRVSPTKVFSALGSQSYASVEQAHIAHDQDTDAHWHARFMQSATNALLTDAERRAGFSILIDNRDYLRGTANERATYYNAGITGGWMTQNEAREAEGYARSIDPSADQLRRAENLFGTQPNKPAK